jgi:ATP-binding cassette subfamily C (CFTR/MRP) protein 1
VFTALSLISLLSVPMQGFATAVPSFAASLSAYTRIQDFLLSSLKYAVGDNDAYRRSNRDSYHGALSSSTELGELNEHTKSMSRSGNIVHAEAASLAFQSSTTPSLRRISMRIPPATLTVVTGPTGSGKSSLLQALLGELVCLEGYIIVKSGDIGYCAQHPWLPAATIKDVIQAAGHHDEAWYRSVLHTCMLDQDLDGFPDNDRTVVGNKGSKLSSGQKQRVASHLPL